MLVAHKLYFTFNVTCLYIAIHVWNIYTSLFSSRSRIQTKNEIVSDGLKYKADICLLDFFTTFDKRTSCMVQRFVDWV